ncbi:hypothetical protein PGB28_09265 [Primorskyibacter aestuariivivens]|uniref:hypothetical protein n=1 Tax=Primorskyibacter aestuariivivens TaxID=1888912 RepID=UPI0023003CB2|nr:hypothetical protein [Primorskyibacter aestuariivivens]MDA7428647.1 hypothetical protein [Primorskyibacter aestuariivivens]
MRMPLLTAALAMCLPGLAPERAAAQDYQQDALCYTGQDEICEFLPVDLTGLKVNPGYTPNTNIADGDSAKQQNFDYFAWQMFVALNWPSDGTGAPEGSILDSGTLDQPRVWESWPGIEHVFDENNNVPATCAAGRLTMSETNKVTSSSFIEPFTPWPLIDVAGNYVMYDIRLNQTEAAYILKNGLNTKAGQQAFGQAWDLPRGVVTSGTHDDVAAAIPGAMEMKTAWRVLPDGDDGLGYFTVPGSVHVAAENSATGEPLCLDVTLGLVGMHVMQKITNPSDFSDFWVWATFEHVRNAPDAANAPVSQSNSNSPLSGNDPVASCPVPTDASGDWAFFNADCTRDGAACAPNTPPAGKSPFLWQAQPPYAASYLDDGKYGTQVTRCFDVYESADNISAKYQDALSGTPFANYQLIGAQWAQAQIVEYPDPLKPFPAPIYLVNSTLETYLQNKPVIDPQTGAPNKNASGSCIICHDIATDSAGNKSDFSFLGGYAH